jgi:hypothetical protein
VIKHEKPIMKTLDKYSSQFGLVLALCVMVISGCSCSAPKPAADPLAGWQKNYTTQPSDQIIEKDYQDYIRNPSTDEQKFTGPVLYYHNGTGQRAVQIEIDIDGKDCWYHILFYDKDNKRIKVIKYFYGRYRS